MSEKILIQALNRKPTNRAPFWFMRQAGRYLPEYRELRSSTDGFLDLCFTPTKAAEVTLQPINRFNMDAAIMFSDILVIPLALGQKVWFVTGEGPKLEPITSSNDIDKLKYDPESLFPIYETLDITSSKLPNDKTLIGFSGSPWTLACYMIEGGGSKNFAKARKFGHTYPEAFSKLLNKVEDAIVDYLSNQIKAGAEVLQLFDSWSGVCSAKEFDDWVIKPTTNIVARIKDKHPEIPIIGFPRLSGEGYVRYAKQTGVDAVSMDVQITPNWAKDNLSEHVVLQGNLDPLLVAYNGDEAIEQAKILLDSYKNVPFIFNFGHGFIPETPIKNVERLVDLLKS